MRQEAHKIKPLSGDKVNHVARSRVLLTIKPHRLKRFSVSLVQ